MDKGTIGPKKCENALNDILIGLEDKFGKDVSKRIIRRVLYLYSRFRDGLKHLKSLDNIRFYHSMALLLRNDTINKLEENRERYELILGEENTTDLLSHFRCCVVATFRDALREKKDEFQRISCCKDG